MRIIDIDLDFFQHEVAHVQKGCCNNYLLPWSIAAVDLYFRRNLGFTHPIKGICVINHHELFEVVQSLVSLNPGLVPIDWVHVDAHSDLGDQWALSYQCCFEGNFGDMQIQKEISEDSNFLLLLGLKGWIGHLDLVLHDRSREYDALTAMKTALLRLYSWFTVTSGSHYMNNEEFDYLFLSYSPDYTSDSIKTVYRHINSNFLTLLSTCQFRYEIMQVKSALD
jgi:hypothetical protein